jgi:hypothetical protein
MNSNWIHTSGQAYEVAKALEAKRKYDERLEAEKLKEKQLCQKK